MTILQQLSGISSSQIKPGMLLVATDCHEVVHKNVNKET
jgi:hypothetical protein